MINETIVEYKNVFSNLDVFTGIYELETSYSSHFDTILIQVIRPHGATVVLMESFAVHYDGNGMLVAEEDVLCETTYLYKDVAEWDGVSFLQDIYENITQ